MPSFQFVSLTDPPPSGFLFDPSPTLASLCSRPFCLYSEDARQAEDLLAPARGEVSGILASNHPTLSWGTPEGCLYRLGIPAELAPWLPTLAAPLLDVLERLRSSDDRAAARALETARALEERARLNQEHAAFRTDILREMGERKRAEQALRESEQQHRVLTENASDVIWSVDMGLNFTYLSPSAERLQQWTPEEWASLRVQDVLTPEAFEQVNRVLAEELAREGVPEVDPNRSRILEIQEYRKDGSIFWAELRASFLRDPEGRPVGVMGVTRDISERKQAEEERRKLEAQLIQAQKLESVGRLAGGIAHELNNMLTPILGYGDMLTHDLALDNPGRTMAQQIVFCAKRCRDLVSQLLAFARKQTLEIRPLDLNNLVVAFERMLRRTLRENVAIELQLAPSAGSILGDRTQIEQVILNLAVNAQDAMPSGGTLRIETEAVTLEWDYWGEDEVKAGPYVMMLVSDTGEGMDRETVRRVFDPFFTTKEVGKGTGLGLSTVYGIVRQHGGHIRVFSEPAGGSVFRLYFPRPREESSTRSALENGRPQGGTETVLVVEDEDQVRDLTVKVLRRQGYSVLEARDGLEALEMLDAYQGPLHLLLTDVVLPNMSGMQLWERLQGQGRDLKVLFMSGYPADVVGDYGVLEGRTPYIQKPFSIRDLAEKVREVLNPSAGLA